MAIAKKKMAKVMHVYNFNYMIAKLPALNAYSTVHQLTQIQ